MCVVECGHVVIFVGSSGVDSVCSVSAMAQVCITSIMSFLHSAWVPPGVCLETQGFPNAVNENAFPSVILGPGERYTHEVDYVFSAE